MSEYNKIFNIEGITEKDQHEYKEYILCSLVKLLKDNVKFVDSVHVWSLPRLFVGYSSQKNHFHVKICFDEEPISVGQGNTSNTICFDVKCFLIKILEDSLPEYIKSVNIRNVHSRISSGNYPMHIVIFEVLFDT